MEVYKADVSRANVDYLTMIYPSDYGEQGLFSRIADYQAKQVALGNVVKYFKLSRYVGTQIGNVGEGVYGFRSCLSVWGDECENWQYLLSDGVVRPTRVDLAVTVLLDKPKPNLVRDTLETHQKGLVSPKYQCNLRTILNLEGGDTLYTGKRDKELLLRLYDKGVQSKLEGIKVGEYWRYEVEFKGNYAERARSSLVLNNFSHEYIRALVSRIFNERAIPVLFGSSTTNNKLQSVAKVSDNQRRLEWIRQTVSPVVKQLKLAGYGSELEEILRLKDYYKQGA